MLERRFKNKKLDIEESIMMHLIKKLGFKEVSEFYKQIADEKLDVNDVIDKYQEVRDHDLKINASKTIQSAQDFEFENPDEEFAKKNDDILVIDRNLKGIDFSLAQCCRPIYGDSVFGFETVRMLMNCVLVLAIESLKPDGAEKEHPNMPLHFV